MDTPFDFMHEIALCAKIDIDWSKLDNKVILVTGATGLVGRYLIEVLLWRNVHRKLHTKIIAIGRDKGKFQKYFSKLDGLEDIFFLQQDIQTPCTYTGRLDYIIHMASNTHPRLYASDPIGTEMTNILGTYHLLQLAAKNKNCRFVFTSSGDIYGDNRSGKQYLSEMDCGYLDCNTLRAGYIEGKRASEALCNAFYEARGVDFVIGRLCRIYGATMQLDDSKAISQFINKAVLGENIILKSEGIQVFSYLYIYDVVSALLTIATIGEGRNAYNVADNQQVIALKDLATMLATIGGSTVVFDLPDSEETKGASNFQDVRLDATKLYHLGWRPVVPLALGLRETVKKLRENRRLDSK